MKKIEKLSDDIHHTAINVGELNDLMDYSLIHPLNKKVVEGKVFLKDVTNATGSEISFNALPPETELPYFHIHRKNEETYIILKGFGSFQVDDVCFDVKEGSVVRVAPEGKRGIYNASKETMTYIVVQTKENSLEEHTTDDGERVLVEPKW